MFKVLDFIKQYRKGILSGLLIGTSFVPFPPWALLFCLTPLFLAWMDPKLSLKQKFLHGWITQFILSLIGFHWIVYTATEYGSLPLPIALTALILFAALIHLYYPLAGIFGATILKFLKIPFNHLSAALIFALSFSIFEHLWPAIFPWNLGYTLLWAKIPAFQLADVIGFEGLTTLVIISNALIAFFWVHRKNTKSFLIHLTAVLGAWGMICLLGYFHGRAFQKTYESNLSDKSISVLAVQANIGNLEKAYAELGRGYQGSIVRKHLSLIDAGLAQYPQAQILLIPETAFPGYLDDHNRTQYTSLLAEGLQKWKLPLMGGGFSKTDDKVYNAFFLVGPDAMSISKPYLKTHLLAFGEYLPLSEQFPFLLKLLPFVSNFARGNGPHLQKWSSYSIGPQICYESLNPRFSAELARLGAQILVNVTNDSWFGRNFEPQQHMLMTLARSIETRLPLLRSTNTGITTAMLPHGVQMQSSPLFEEWVGEFKIPIEENPPLTFFVRYGQFYLAVLISVLCLLIAWGIYDSKNAKS